MVYPHVQDDGSAHPDQLRPKAPAVARELDSRTSDGIHVRLLWHPDDGQVSVAVDDTKTGEVFELPVGDRDSAVEVFQHPFAYADGRRRAPKPTARPANGAIAA